MRMTNDYTGYVKGVVPYPLIVKYRPTNFETFIGNENEIEDLRDILKRKSTHTFLITGQIGCGKTSLARIIAKELGCTKLGYDLFEQNSAEYTGIDNMREILHRSSFGSKRTIIFDEAHKLSNSAQNAALKHFEESPSSAYYILCTDKPEKIISGIKSRSFDYNLSPLFSGEILKLLRRVCATEGWELSEEVLNRVAKESGGIPREALKKLEKAYHRRDNFIPEIDRNRVFVLQNMSDLECFQYITKNKTNYSTLFIGSNDIERVIGRDVIVIQIKNEVGMKSTETFLRRIDGLPKSVKTVEMPGDEIRSFEDWINSQFEDNNNTNILQDFEDIINIPPELTFPSLHTATDQFIMPFREFYELELPEREMIMAPWLLEGDLIMLAADSGTGKSLFAMEIAAACSSGRNAMSGLWTPQKTHPVLYIDGEMHWEDIKVRGHLFGLNDCFILSRTVCIHKNGSPELDITKDEIRNFLSRYITNKGIKLVVLDNVDSLCDGLDHSSGVKWWPINQWLLTLRSNGVSVILVHHTNKKGSPMGTSARRFKLDHSFILKEKRSYVNTNSAMCAFSVKVDKLRRGLERVELKLFICEDGKWDVRDMNESDEKKQSGRKEDELSKKKKARIALGLVEGRKQNNIAEEIGCSPPYINTVKNYFIVKGMLHQNKDTKSYELTEAGKKWIAEISQSC